MKDIREPVILDIHHKILELENLGCWDTANRVREQLQTLLDTMNSFSDHVQSLRTDMSILSKSTDDNKIDLNDWVSKNIVKPIPNEPA